jgi:hypothetical protein
MHISLELPERTFRNSWELIWKCTRRRTSFFRHIRRPEQISFGHDYGSGSVPRYIRTKETRIQGVEQFRHDPRIVLMEKILILFVGCHLSGNGVVSLAKNLFDVRRSCSSRTFQLQPRVSWSITLLQTFKWWWRQYETDAKRNTRQAQKLFGIRSDKCEDFRRKNRKNLEGNKVRLNHVSIESNCLRL